MRHIIFILLALMSIKMFAADEFCQPVGFNSSLVKQVIIIPGVGGANPIDITLKKQLCSNGFKTAIVDSNLSYLVFDTDYGVHDRWTNQFLASVKLVMDKNPQPTVIIGSSLGGIFTSVAYSKNEELFQGNLKGMITVVSGGPLYDVIENSYLPQIKILNFQRKFIKYLLWSDDERHQALIGNIKLDLNKLARPDLSSKILMYIADYDSIVPTFAQMALWEAWGRPASIHIFGEHVATIAWVYTNRINEIIQFILDLK